MRSGLLLGAIAWPVDPEQAREHFASAISSPGALLTPFTRAIYRTIALAGLGRVSDAKRELDAALPTREDNEKELDGTTARLLQRLQDGIGRFRPRSPEVSGSATLHPFRHNALTRDAGTPPERRC